MTAKRGQGGITVNLADSSLSANHFVVWSHNIKKLYVIIPSHLQVIPTGGELIISEFSKCFAIASIVVAESIVPTSLRFVFIGLFDHKWKRISYSVICRVLLSNYSGSIAAWFANQMHIIINALFSPFLSSNWVIIQVGTGAQTIVVISLMSALLYQEYLPEIPAITKEIFSVSQHVIVGH